MLTPVIEEGTPIVINRLLAQCTVSDLARAEQWYSQLIGRARDARPMDGLIEWHLAETFGLQVFAEPNGPGTLRWFSRRPTWTASRHSSPPPASATRGPSP